MENLLHKEGLDHKMASFGRTTAPTKTATSVLSRDYHLDFWTAHALMIPLWGEDDATSVAQPAHGAASVAEAAPHILQVTPKSMPKRPQADTFAQGTMAGTATQPLPEPHLLYL